MYKEYKKLLTKRIGGRCLLLLAGLSTHRVDEDISLLNYMMGLE